MTNKNIYTFDNNPITGKGNCAFCSDVQTGIYWLRTRRVRDNKLLALDYCCEKCRERYDNEEFKKCEKCERFYTQNDFKVDFARTLKESSEVNLGEWVCLCESLKKIGKSDEEMEENEVGSNAGLEKQLHELSLEKSKVEEDLQIEQEAHLDGIDATARWYKRQHEEEMTPLQEKSRRLSDENKKLKSRIKELETQLLDVEEVNKKVHGLSNENRNLKSKVEGLEAEIEKYKGGVSDIQPTVSQLKFDILRLESRLEQMLLGTKLEAQIQITPN